MEGRIALGHVYAEMGRYADAASVYEELLTLRPEEPDVMVNYAEALARVSWKPFHGKAGGVIEAGAGISA